MDIQCQQFGHLVYRKQEQFILGRRLHEKVLWIFNRIHKKYNWFWKEKMLLLREKELKTCEDTKECYVCRKKFIQKLAKDKSF